MSDAWRIVLITTVPPVAANLTRGLEAAGHRVVAVVGARRGAAEPVAGRPSLADETAPPGVDVLLPRDKWAIEGLLRAEAPDLVVCWGYPWKIPLAALQVPRLGSVNVHPALLPRHRGPVPLAWAIRDGDRQWGLTFHRMDAELDTGPILAQAAIPIHDDDVSIEQVGPRMAEAARGLLPRVLERIAAGDPGDPQPAEGASWAGHFGEDYASVDWGRTAREVYDQVRAWSFTFGVGPVAGPIAEVDGRRLRLLRVSLADPGSDALRVACADGPLWIIESEELAARDPLEATAS